MNLASALTGGFAQDINVQRDTINLGNQLMFMGIVILEIPCNIALQRVSPFLLLHPPNLNGNSRLISTKIGPRKWIAGQVLLFGTVATMQVFVKNRGGFLAIRLMLGLAEAGYIPGAIYTLSTWYTKREIAKRVSVFFFDMFVLTMCSRRPLHNTGIIHPTALPARKPGSSSTAGRARTCEVFD